MSNTTVKFSKLLRLGVKMTDQVEILGDILSRIADELNITDTMYKKAVSSYESVGEWIGEGLDYDPCIMPQGSMNLGTVVRPLSDKEDYDIDLVCLLKNGKKLTAEQVKKKVGDRLKENKLFAGKLDPEGKRCWTLQYNDFHMDILPCVPHAQSYINPGQTAIDLTDKNKRLNNYRFKPSDPAAYHDWFYAKAQPLYTLMNSRMAAKATEIKPVPNNASCLKTPLQKAIQLLKRHRDVCFQKNPDNAPISIIITTLAAEACPHESNVYVALAKILERIPKLVESHNGFYKVKNPVMPDENFAEKWNVDPNKYKAFVDWCAKANMELIKVTEKRGLDELAAHYKKVLMSQPVERAFRNYGDDALKARMNGALRVVGPTFGLSTTAKMGKTVSSHTFYGA